MNLQPVTLVSFGYFEKELLSRLSDSVQMEFQTTVNMWENHTDLIEYYDPARRQYNGNRLLALVNSLLKKDNGKIIGLFNVDLFIPILTYIFGQAMLNGQAGVASMYRLSNQRYGMKLDEPLLYDRFTKELIHELGHTYGLIHCHQPSCVMRSSTYVEEIDLKTSRFCNHCKDKLE
jgi:archaemetzincin